ncbi:dentin sialophosphoprotein-like [Clytia hemisphaerica]|uniref:Uncharacterized protein n=1 Tax=Clytia hemisphaerica TaxID=252671 RepID=A0A7M5X611_9CNID
MMDDNNLSRHDAQYFGSQSSARTGDDHGSSWDLGLAKRAISGCKDPNEFIRIYETFGVAEAKRYILNQINIRHETEVPHSLLVEKIKKSFHTDKDPRVFLKIHEIFGPEVARVYFLAHEESDGDMSDSSHDDDDGYWTGHQLRPKYDVESGTESSQSSDRTSFYSKNHSPSSDGIPSEQRGRYNCVRKRDECLARKLKRKYKFDDKSSESDKDNHGRQSYRHHRKRSRSTRSSLSSVRKSRKSRYSESYGSLGNSATLPTRSGIETPSLYSRASYRSEQTTSRENSPDSLKSIGLSSSSNQASITDSNGSFRSLERQYMEPTITHDSSSQTGRLSESSQLLKSYSEYSTSTTTDNEDRIVDTEDSDEFTDREPTVQELETFNCYVAHNEGRNRYAINPSKPLKVQAFLMASDSVADAEQLFVPRRSALIKVGSPSVKESDKAISVYSSLSSHSSLKSCSIRDFVNRDKPAKGAADSSITASSDSAVSDSTASFTRVSGASERSSLCLFQKQPSYQSSSAMSTSSYESSEYSSGTDNCYSLSSLRKLSSERSASAMSSDSSDSYHSIQSGDRHIGSNSPLNDTSTFQRQSRKRSARMSTNPSTKRAKLQ